MQSSRRCRAFSKILPLLNRLGPCSNDCLRLVENKTIAVASPAGENCNVTERPQRRCVGACAPDRAQQRQSDDRSVESSAMTVHTPTLLTPEEFASLIEVAVSAPEPNVPSAHLVKLVSLGYVAMTERGPIVTGDGLMRITESE